MLNIILQTWENTFYSLLKDLGNPILAILLLVLAAAIYYLVKQNNQKDKKVDDLYKIVLDIKDSDKEILLGLKNTLQNHTKIEEDNTENIKKINDLIIQLITKIDAKIK